MNQIYYISTGEGHKLFTLRTAYEELYPNGAVYPRDYHIANLSNDFDKAKEKAKAYAKERGVPLSKPDDPRIPLRPIKHRSAEDVAAEKAAAEEAKLAAKNEFISRRRADLEAMLAAVRVHVHPWGKYKGYMIGEERFLYADNDGKEVRGPDYGYLDFIARSEGEFLKDGDDDFQIVLLTNAVAKAVKEKVIELFPELGQKLPEPNGEYFGKIKDRVDIKATVIGRYSFEGYYGMTYVTKMVADSGELLVYMGSVSLSEFVGQELEFKATVKEHGEYKDELQTKIARPKIKKGE